MLTVITFLPLLSVLALLLLRSDDHAWIRRIALAASLAEFVISLFLLRGFDPADPHYQFEEVHNWIGQAIHYHLGVDGISLFLVLLTTFLTPIAILCSWQSIHDNVKGFFLSILVIETAMIGVFVSLDLFLFFVFWELTLIPMYFMIGMWGHERRIYAAVKFILYTMFGSILMLVAILWLYNLTGTFDLQDIESKLQAGIVALPPAHGTSALRRLLPGVCDQGAAVPVAHMAAGRAYRSAHGRLGDSGRRDAEARHLRHPALLPAAVSGRGASRGSLIGVLAIIGIVYGALVATMQHDLKRLVAYTSVSHLGFVVLGFFAFSTISIQGAIYQMLNHGISTGALFLARRHALRPPAHARNQGVRRPRESHAGADGLLSVHRLSSLALPPLNGFIGEFLILIGTFAHIISGPRGPPAARCFRRSTCCGHTSASRSAMSRWRRIARCPTPTDARSSSSSPCPS